MTDLVKCEDCKFLDKEKYPKHATVGFGQCKLDREPGKFYSVVYMKVCEHYKAKDEIRKD